MVWRCAVVSFLCFAQNFSSALAKAPGENSEQTETVEEATEKPGRTPAIKSKASEGERPISAGSTRSDPSRPDGLSIAKPPSQLDSRSTSLPAAKNFLVAIDIGH